MSPVRTSVHYLLRYTLADDYLDRRPTPRAEHLALYREAVDRGELVLGGALAEPTDEALLVFRTADRATVEAFAQRDPYVRHGLVTHYDIRAWHVVDPEPS